MGKCWPWVSSLLNPFAILQFCSYLDEFCSEIMVILLINLFVYFLTDVQSATMCPFLVFIIVLKYFIIIQKHLFFTSKFPSTFRLFPQFRQCWETESERKREWKVDTIVLLKNSDDCNIISGLQPRGNIDQLHSHDNFNLITYVFSFSVCIVDTRAKLLCNITN